MITLLVVLCAVVLVLLVSYLYVEYVFSGLEDDDWDVSSSLSGDNGWTDLRCGDDSKSKTDERP